MGGFNKMNDDRELLGFNSSSQSGSDDGEVEAATKLIQNAKKRWKKGEIKSNPGSGEQVADEASAGAQQIATARQKWLKGGTISSKPHKKSILMFASVGTLEKKQSIHGTGPDTPEDKDRLVDQLGVSIKTEIEIRMDLVSRYRRHRHFGGTLLHGQERVHEEQEIQNSSMAEVRAFVRHHPETAAIFENYPQSIADEFFAGDYDRTKGSGVSSLLAKKDKKTKRPKRPSYGSVVLQILDRMHPSAEDSVIPSVIAPMPPMVPPQNSQRVVDTMGVSIKTDDEIRIDLATRNRRHRHSGAEFLHHQDDPHPDPRVQGESVREVKAFINENPVFSKEFMNMPFGIGMNTVQVQEVSPVPVMAKNAKGLFLVNGGSARLLGENKPSNALETKRLSNYAIVMMHENGNTARILGGTEKFVMDRANYLATQNPNKEIIIGKSIGFMLDGKTIYSSFKKLHSEGVKTKEIQVQKFSKSFQSQGKSSESKPAVQAKLRTSSDPIDGHVHQVFIDKNGMGKTSVNTGKKFQEHFHMIQGKKIIPVEQEIYISKHPGGLQAVFEASQPAWGWRSEDDIGREIYQSSPLFSRRHLRMRKKKKKKKKKSKR